MNANRKRPNAMEQTRPHKLTEHECVQIAAYMVYNNIPDSEVDEVIAEFLKKKGKNYDYVLCSNLASRVEKEN